MTRHPSLNRRRPDPARLIAAYHQSASTLNLLRAFTKGGFADMTQVHMWNQQFVASSREGQRYEAIAGEIDRALRFMANTMDRFDWNLMITSHQPLDDINDALADLGTDNS